MRQLRLPSSPIGGGLDSSDSDVSLHGAKPVLRVFSSESGQLAVLVLSRVPPDTGNEAIRDVASSPRNAFLSDTTSASSVDDGSTP